METCPDCKKSTIIGHFHAQSWRIELAIDPAIDHIPLPFCADHGHHRCLERGRHALTLGYACDQQARDFAQRVFPEARVVRMLRCDISGEPVIGLHACTIPGC